MISEEEKWPWRQKHLSSVYVYVCTCMCACLPTYISIYRERYACAQGKELHSFITGQQTLVVFIQFLKAENMNSALRMSECYSSFAM